MLDSKQREIAETIFDRNQRREAEINDALAQEVARHAAVVKNMHRLRALRLSRDQAKTGKHEA
jgi:predicted transcriptional regulator